MTTLLTAEAEAMQEQGETDATSEPVADSTTAIHPPICLDLLAEEETALTVLAVKEGGLPGLTLMARLRLTET